MRKWFGSAAVHGMKPDSSTQAGEKAKGNATGPTAAKAQTLLRSSLAKKKYDKVGTIATLFVNGKIPVNAQACTALQLLIECLQETKPEHVPYFQRLLGIAEKERHAQAEAAAAAATAAAAAEKAQKAYASPAIPDHIHVSPVDLVMDEGVVKGEYVERLEKLLDERQGTMDFTLVRDCEAKWRMWYPVSHVAEATALLYVSNTPQMRKLHKGAMWTRGCVATHQLQTPALATIVLSKKNAMWRARNIAAKAMLRELSTLVCKLEAAAASQLANDVRKICRVWMHRRREGSQHAHAIANARRLVQRADDGYLVGAKVNAYGSRTSGIALGDSDMDLSIKLPGLRTLDDEFTGKEARLNCLTMLCKAAQDEGMADMQVVRKARVPLLRYYDAAANMEVDVTVGTEGSVLLSRLLRAHMAADQRVWQLSMCVKHWARQRDICGAADGFLNSMSWTILVIFFLQHVVRPPLSPLLIVVPPRADADDADVEASIVCEPWRCAGADGNGGGRDKGLSIGALVCEFFRFYGDDFDFGKEIISLRLGRRHALDGKKAMANVAVFVEQPLRALDNVVGYVDAQTMKITLYELQRAAGICRAQGDLHEVFEKRV